MIGAIMPTGCNICILVFVQNFVSFDSFLFRWEEGIISATEWEFLFAAVNLHKLSEWATNEISLLTRQFQGEMQCNIIVMGAISKSMAEIVEEGNKSLIGNGGSADVLSEQARWQYHSSKSGRGVGCRWHVAKGEHFGPIFLWSSYGASTDLVEKICLVDGRGQIKSSRDLSFEMRRGGSLAGE